MVILKNINFIECGRKNLTIVMMMFIMNGIIAQNITTLSDIRKDARLKSLGVFEAEIDKSKANLSYKVYKSQFKPHVNLNASLPNYTKSFRETIQPDGTISFQSISQNNSVLGVSALQNIPWTGGQIFAVSDIQRFDNFKDTSTLYNGIPFRIGINQPIFGYNSFKYQKKIQPLLLEESEKEYNVEVESTLYDISHLFFDVIIAVENKKIAKLNNEINNNLINITTERYNLGKVSKDEKLQLEIELQNSRLNFNQASLAYQQAHFMLQTAIGNDNFEDSITYILPEPMTSIDVDIDLAINKSMNNRPEFIKFRREYIQSKDNLAQKKHQYGIQANLTASYGLARSANKLADVYENPLDEQQIKLTVSVPILDWGQKKSVLKMAQLDIESSQRKSKQEEMVLRNNTKSICLRFLQLQSEISLQKSILEKTIERFDISNQRYILGNISISDLTLAQRDNNQAQRNYILTLRNYWLSYYQLRLMTGYDFLAQKTIEY